MNGINNMDPNKQKYEHYFTEKPTSKTITYDISAMIFDKQYIFKTATGVFSYKKIDKGTSILLKYAVLPEKENAKILDLGCGYGVIGIVLADILPKSQVTLIDINQRAIWLCKKNVRLNNVNNVKVLSGDFFEKINETFDLIITNPPLKLGKKTLHRIFERSKQLLIQNGSFQTVIRTKQGAKSAMEKLKEIFGSDNVRLVKVKSGFRVYEARKI
ncbi:MAG: class I SAM-dependent methyltransferase [Candidatus Helarchaeota archaeon]